MSKYDPLWESVQQSGLEMLTLSFGQIEECLGFSIDHSFLTFKKELPAYGYQVVKISRKEQWVRFQKDNG